MKQKQNNYKLLILDFDGVLVDTFHIGLKLERMQYPEITEDEYRSYFNGNYFKKRKKINNPNIDIDEEHHKAMKGLVVEESKRKAIKYLAQKYPIVINSSSPEKSINEILKNNSLLQYVGKIYGRSTSHDKRVKFKMILEDYDISPTECIFATDTLGDIIEAREAGIETIGVDGGFSLRSALEKGHPKEIINHFTDLVSILY